MAVTKLREVASLLEDLRFAFMNIWIIKKHMCINYNHNWCDRATCTCFWHEVAFPETLSLTEGFLGIASVLPWLGRLAIHDKSPCKSCISMGILP
jgi:hypothetical protein